MTKEEPKKTIGSLTVDSIMIKDVHTIDPTMTVKEAIQLLLTHKISGAPVVGAMGKAISVISQTDLMKFAAGGSMDKQIITLLDKLVSPENLIVVRKADPFKEVFKQFLIKPVRRVLVVDGTGKLLGIVSRSTILKAFMDTAT
jgi:predicted transcriptional regulator